jgi:hypothetical protein
VAGSTGLEPAASGVTGRRSNQLNYDPKKNYRIAEGRLQISDWGVRPIEKQSARPANLQSSINNLQSAICNLQSQKVDWAVQDSNL